MEMSFWIRDGEAIWVVEKNSMSFWGFVGFFLSPCDEDGGDGDG